MLARPQGEAPGQSECADLQVGVEPEIIRIGKYKSAGDQLLRKDMSGEPAPPAGILALASTHICRHASRLRCACPHAPLRPPGLPQPGRAVPCRALRYVPMIYLTPTTLTTSSLRTNVFLTHVHRRAA